MRIPNPPGASPKWVTMKENAEVVARHEWCPELLLHRPEQRPRKSLLWVAASVLNVMMQSQPQGSHT